MYLFKDFDYNSRRATLQRRFSVKRLFLQSTSQQLILYFVFLASQKLQIQQFFQYLTFICLHLTVANVIISWWRRMMMRLAMLHFADVGTSLSCDLTSNFLSIFIPYMNKSYKNAARHQFHERNQKLFLHIINYTQTNCAKFCLNVPQF